MDKRVMPKFANRYVSRYFLRFIKKFGAQLNTGMNVLDVGAGRFRHTCFLQNVGMHRITCIDKLTFPSRPNGITFIEHDLERGLPIYDPHGFDLIICTQVFMFIRNRHFLLDEIDRVARDGAYLVLEINRRKLAFGDPIDMENIVNYLLGLGTWQVLDRLRKQGKVGVVMQRVGSQGLAPVGAAAR